MTAIYWIESGDAQGRQEEIYGPDARARCWTGREAAEAALADLRDDPAYPGVEYELAEGDLYGGSLYDGAPEWAEEIVADAEGIDGRWVVGGETGEDCDVGRVLAVAGGRLDVAWTSSRQTTRQRPAGLLLLTGGASPTALAATSYVLGERIAREGLRRGRVDTGGGALIRLADRLSDDLTLEGETR